MVKIGLKKAYWAEIVSDVQGAIAYNAPLALPGIQQVQVNPKVSRVQVPADDVVSEDITQCLGADVTVQRKDVTLEEEKIILGRKMDANGGVYGGTNDNPPYGAFGYMRTFSDGTALYVWLLKTKFAPSNSTADTKAVDSVTPQYDQMTASALTREADGEWIYSCRSADPNFAATFFTQATLQALSSGIVPDAIALSSSVPADDATGVSKTAAITLTFSNTILAEAVSLINTDGTLVTTTRSLDATGKILTITPSVALSGTTTYILAVNGVTDIYGQTLAPAVRNFTTAA
jgi:phi13 family phage major tail protein